MPQAPPKSRGRSTTRRRKVGRHRIRESIERMILDGHFRPGEKLVQFQLAKKFGVSQGMIREALFELKEYGLVEASDNRGMFVRSLDIRTVYEMLVVREVFDGVIARECCGRMSTGEAAKLRKMAEDIFEAAVAGRQRQKVELDRRFHLELAKLTDNRVLLMWAKQHHTFGKVMGLSRTVKPDETRQGHLAIVDAIVAGDRNEAEQVARAHVRAAWSYMVEALAAGPEMVLWLTSEKRSKRR